MVRDKIAPLDAAYLAAGGLANRRQFTPRQNEIPEATAKARGL